MRFWRPRATVRWLTVFVLLAGVVAVYRHAVRVNPTTVALTFVLLILVLAARWELRYAIATSIAATAAYNFYFLPPVGTFTIADPQNWLALLAFLGTSIVGSRLSQKARDQAETALRRQHELEVLYSLSRDLLEARSLSAIVFSAPQLIHSAAHAESVNLYLLDGDQLHLAGVRRQLEMETPHLRETALTLSSVQPVGDHTMLVPLRSGPHPKGLLIVRGTDLSNGSLEAIGVLVSITLDHAQAIDEAAKSEASKENERLRTLILDSITHELRTPLTSIKGAAGTLLTDLEMSTDDRRELLSIVDEEADRLNRLVGQALEMARVEARDVKLHVEFLDVAEIVEEAIENCAWVTSSRSIHVDISQLPKVPGDRELLGKLICNLLENAAKYSSAPSPVFVSGKLQPGTIALSVADQGIGIDPSEQSLIFDRLYRSRTQTEGTSGTGMGLAICRAIVEAHHGEIGVTSQLGLGSVFTFTLPLTHSG